MKTIIIPKVIEHDVTIRFPGGQEWLIQYRNYEGDAKTGEGASVDLILDHTRPVYNWKGEEMKAARAVRKSEPHVRKADQLCIVL